MNYAEAVGDYERIKEAAEDFAAMVDDAEVAGDIMAQLATAAATHAATIARYGDPGEPNPFRVPSFSSRSTELPRLHDGLRYSGGVVDEAFKSVLATEELEYPDSERTNEDDQ